MHKSAQRCAASNEHPQIRRSQADVGEKRSPLEKFDPVVTEAKLVGPPERFGVDSDTCTGDHSCIRLSGCPSLTIRPNPDPLRRDPVAHVENSCVGCGHCGEVSHAAVLCPSFYRASIVSNAGRWEKTRAKWRQRLIGWLQRRDDRARAARAF